MRRSCGIFFDLDGTLADSIVVMRSTYQRFAASFGRAGSDAEFEVINGPPLTMVVAVLKERWQLSARPKDLIERYEALIDEAYAKVAPMPDAEIVLKASVEHGWVVGVVTSNAARRASLWLDRVGLAPAVDVLVAGDDVVSGKPAPEPYLKALAAGRCTAATSLAVEDAPQGAAAAVAAGLRTYGITSAGEGIGRWPASVAMLGGLSDLIPVVTAELPARRAMNPPRRPHGAFLGC